MTELISSTDDHIRAAKVKVMSATGRPTILQRPIQLLYPLETREASPDDGAPEAEDNQRRADSPPADDEEDTPQGEPSQPVRPSRRAAKKAREQLQGLAAQNLV